MVIMQQKKEQEMFLENLSTYFKQTLNSDLFETNWRWRHYYALMRIESSWRCRHKATISKKEKREVLRYAQELLAPLTDEISCQQMKQKCTDCGYCPDTPYGKYIWTFTCLMVQEILWLYPEFVAGFLFGCDPVPLYRDANPYQDLSREISWDRGYILGLEHDNVAEWLAKKNNL